MAHIQLAALVKCFGSTTVVHDIDLTIADGEFVVLVGPSGCGKSTILRMVAGLEEVSGGTIAIGDRIVNRLAPRERNVAMVFQDYALYPHMSVAENIGFGLMIRGETAGERGPKVQAAARTLEIEHLLDRRPAALSGGQRQRVAMGRCLVRRPEAFLFDEPLSNLDAKLRGLMRAEIKRFHRQTGVTSVYVTHDQVEAMTLADRIVCLEGGRIAQAGSPEDLYERPVSRFVAGFIGSPAMNFIEGRLELAHGAARFSLPNGNHIRLPDRLAGAAAGQDGRPAVLGIRPEHLTDPDSARRPRDPVEITLRADLTEPLGADTLIHSKVGPHAIVARCSPHAAPADGAEVRLVADMGRAHLFDPASGAALA